MSVYFLPPSSRTSTSSRSGASAQYGADAVGGVVNFILDRDFEGIKATASTGKPERSGGGFSRKFGLAGGTRLGEKMHVVASLDYNRIDQIQRDPTQLGDWFQRYGFVSNPAWRSNPRCAGSPLGCICISLAACSLRCAAVACIRFLKTLGFRLLLLAVIVFACSLQLVRLYLYSLFAFSFRIGLYLYSLYSLQLAACGCMTCIRSWL